MRVASRILFFTVVLFFAMHSNATAQNRYALVIGNANYLDRRIDNLPNARNDAEDITNALKELEFHVDHRDNLDRRQLIRAIGDFLGRLKNNKDSEGFFWYAGHAVEINDENFLLPVDFPHELDEHIVRNEAYSLNLLLSELRGVENKINIVILDSCRNNPLSSGGRSVGRSRGISMPSRSIPPEMFIMYSAEPGEIASDGNVGERNSPFAQAFLYHIKSSESLVQMSTEVIRTTVINTENTRNPQRPWIHHSLAEQGRYTLNPMDIRPSETTLLTRIHLTPIPKNVRQGTVGTNNAVIRWNSAGSDLSYNVYYHPKNNPGNERSMTITETTTDLTNLSANTTYNVWVTAVQEGRESERSDIISIRTQRQPRPEIPQEKLWTIGGSVGTSFSAPLFIYTLRGTLAPFRYSFLEIGIDGGLGSGVSDVDYNSLYPFVHYVSFTPYDKGGGFYLGGGFGYMIAKYSFPEGDYSRNTFVPALTTGVNIANIIDLSYTLRTNFKKANNKISVGYTYRFR